MRVGINARTFVENEPDGAVQASRKLTKSLLSRDDIEIVLYGDAQLEDEFRGADCISTGYLSDSAFYGVIWERTVLPYLIQQSDIDILLCPNGNAPPIPIPVPVVTYVHDVNAQKGMSSGIHGIYRRMLVPPGVNHSDAVVTVSKFSKSEIATHLPVCKSDIHVVYNGIDNLFFQEGSGKPLDLPQEYFLYVGGLNPRKNVRRLVKAYYEVRDSTPHSLVLIGPDNKLVYKNIGDLSTSSDLVMPGFVSPKQLKYAYTHTTGLVFPSLYEGFGLPPLEAMACGTPVISSDRSSMPEILNGYARLIDPTNVNALAEAMLDLAATNKLQETDVALKNHAEMFTWERATNEIINVMRDVI